MRWSKWHSNIPWFPVKSRFLGGNDWHCFKTHQKQNVNKIHLKNKSGKTTSYIVCSTHLFYKPEKHVFLTIFLFLFLLKTTTPLIWLIYVLNWYMKNMNSYIWTVVLINQNTNTFIFETFKLQLRDKTVKSLLHNS